MPTSPPSQKPVSQILIEARALINTREKWFGPHGLRGGGPQNCAGTAICRVTGDWGNWTTPAFVALGEVIGAHVCPDGTVAIASWNNAPGRTHGEVMLAFAKSIEVQELREQQAEKLPAVRNDPLHSVGSRADQRRAGPSEAFTHDPVLTSP